MPVDDLADEGSRDDGRYRIDHEIPGDFGYTLFRCMKRDEGRDRAEADVHKQHGYRGQKRPALEEGIELARRGRIRGPGARGRGCFGRIHVGVAPFAQMLGVCQGEQQRQYGEASRNAQHVQGARPLHEVDGQRRRDRSGNRRGHREVPHTLGEAFFRDDVGSNRGCGR